MDKVRWQEIADSALDRAVDIDIVDTEPVRAEKKPPSPTSVRLSAPLLARLDHIAGKEGRKRGNLIQHILWEYVRARERYHEDDLTVESTPARGAPAR